MTKKEFIASRVKMTPKKYEETIGVVELNYDNEMLYVYDEWAYIIIMENNTYNLIIERSEYNSENLQELEDILWDWAQHEVN